ncbi:MAG: hypothetical protein Rhob2KO_53830 [Rhodopirellula baltica]
MWSVIAPIVAFLGGTYFFSGHGKPDLTGTWVNRFDPKKYETRLHFSPDGSFTKREILRGRYNAPDRETVYTGSYHFQDGKRYGDILFLSLHSAVAKENNEIVDARPEASSWSAACKYGWTSQGHLLLTPAYGRSTGMMKQFDFLPPTLEFYTSEDR